MRKCHKFIALFYFRAARCVRFFSLSLRCIPVSGGYLLTNSIVISFNWSVKGLRVCWIYWRNNCKLNPSSFAIEDEKKHTHTQMRRSSESVRSTQFALPRINFNWLLFNWLSSKSKGSRISRSLYLWKSWLLNENTKCVRTAPRAQFARVLPKREYCRLAVPLTIIAIRWHSIDQSIASSSVRVISWCVVFYLQLHLTAVYLVYAK